jgi:uncharacterized protein
MQQYIVYAWDGTDEDAQERRMTSRPAHFDNARKMKAAGNFVLGGAILDDNGKMIGSMMIVQFGSPEELEQWMQTEPYITGQVWKKIDVRPFRMADV